MFPLQIEIVRKTRKSLVNLVIYQAPCSVTACFCFVFGVVEDFLSCFVFGADVRTYRRTSSVKLMTTYWTGPGGSVIAIKIN